jgi:flap endonuclease-1
MGIRNLNRFLKEECKPAIKFTRFAELTGKTIAVDISIYMYKYATDGTLIENVYLMLSVFQHYGIQPIFVFDGKPPDEKRELLDKRKNDKITAKQEYDALHNQLSSGQIDEHDKHDIQCQMDVLKKQFVYLSRQQIGDVKKLIRSFGAMYVEALGEADELCALLVINGQAWACLSEDMDMFVYGCTRVLRYMSLLNHTVVLYELKGILERLGITQKELRQICVLAGTDYNDSAFQLPTVLKLFKKFHRQTEFSDFYEWISLEQNIDIDKLNHICSMFELDGELVCQQPIVNNRCKDDLKNILQTDGFLFPV